MLYIHRDVLNESCSNTSHHRLYSFIEALKFGICANPKNLSIGVPRNQLSPPTPHGFMVCPNPQENAIFRQEHRSKALFTTRSTRRIETKIASERTPDNSGEVHPERWVKPLTQSKSIEFEREVGWTRRTYDIGSCVTNHGAQGRVVVSIDYPASWISFQDFLDLGSHLFGRHFDPTRSPMNLVQFDARYA
jgi:hypothetical protein